MSFCFPRIGVESIETHDDSMELPRVILKRLEKLVLENGPVGGEVAPDTLLPEISKFLDEGGIEHDFAMGSEASGLVGHLIDDFLEEVKVHYSV
jgi:hypothetical protein